MSDDPNNVPDDIVSEKRIEKALRHKYKGAIFGGLRKFRALRLQAPGVIAEFILGALISIVGLLILFYALNATGLLPTIAACIKIVIIIGLSFWAAGRIWRAIGLANRDRIRFVVTNMWSLAATGIVLLSMVLSIFNPEFGKSSEASLPLTNPVVTAAPEKVAAPSHQRRPNERVFRGRGWQIPHNADASYKKALVNEAAALCGELGDKWILADRPDFDDLEAELIDGGHVGSFWTASSKPNSNLDYFLNADGSSEFRWALSANDTRRIVLCVMAIAI